MHHEGPIPECYYADEIRSGLFDRIMRGEPITVEEFCDAFENGDHPVRRPKEEYEAIARHWSNHTVCFGPVRKGEVTYIRTGSRRIGYKMVEVTAIRDIKACEEVEFDLDKGTLG